MRIVSTSYSKTPDYSDPVEWLKRIRFYTGFLEELTKEHEVISIERINYEGKLSQNGVNYYFMNLPKKVVRFPLRMHRFIKEWKPDVVLVNGFIFPLQIIQLKLALGSKVTVIVLHRAEKPFSGFKLWLQKLADKFVDGYFFASKEFGSQWMKKGIIRDAGKIHEVLHVSSHFHLQNRKIARDKTGVNGSPVYLWVGRLDANKDPVTVVKAFFQLLHQQPTAKLYLIYQSDELLAEVSSLVSADTAAAQAVQLVGKVAHEKLEDWYNSADFLISSSHYEGSGIAVAEAMSCGCIPILSNIVSFRRITGPGKCGLLYEAGNSHALFEVLQQSLTLNMEEEQKKVVEQFQNELSFTAIANKINRILNTSANR